MASVKMKEEQRRIAAVPRHTGLKSNKAKALKDKAPIPSAQKKNWMHQVQSRNSNAVLKSRYLKIKIKIKTDITLLKTRDKTTKALKTNYTRKQFILSWSYNHAHEIKRFN